jgi:hypothetical protein
MGSDRVLVVFDTSASARRALAAAASLSEPLTVVSLAPRDARAARCGFYTADLEHAVRDAAKRDLERARVLLGARARTAEFVVLATRAVDELGAWAAGSGFHTALVGERRALLGIRARDLRARSLARAGLAVKTVR